MPMSTTSVDAVKRLWQTPGYMLVQNTLVLSGVIISYLLKITERKYRRTNLHKIELNNHEMWKLKETDNQKTESTITKEPHRFEV